MASKKQEIVHNGTPSKGITNTTTGGTVPSYVVDREYATEDTGSSF